MVKEYVNSVVYEITLKDHGVAILQNFAVTGHRRASAAVLREGGCPLSDAADVGRNLKGFVATFVTPQGGT